MISQHEKEEPKEANPNIYQWRSSIEGATVFTYIGFESLYNHREPTNTTAKR